MGLLKPYYSEVENLSSFYDLNLIWIESYGHDFNIFDTRNLVSFDREPIMMVETWNRPFALGHKP